MYLADTLCRTYQPQVHACEFYQHLEAVDQLKAYAFHID